MNLRSLLAAVLLVIVLLTIYLRAYSPETVFLGDDQALTSAIALENIHGDISLSGPPAALGGRHAGPYYYYWETLLLLLARGDYFYAALLGTAFKIIFAVILLLAFQSAFDASPVFLIAAGLSLAALPWWHWIFTVTWHPNALFPVTALALLSLLKFNRGNNDAFGWTVILSMLIAAFHLAAAPVAMALILCACISAGSKNRRGDFLQWLRSRRAAAFICAAVAVWIPSLIYELEFNANLRHVLGATSRHGPRAGFAAAAASLDSFIYDLILPFKAANQAAAVEICSALWLIAGIWLVVSRAFYAGGAIRQFVAAFGAIYLCYLFCLSRLPQTLDAHYLSSFALVPAVFVGLAFERAFVMGISVRKSPMAAAYVIFLGYGILLYVEGAIRNFEAPTDTPGFKLQTIAAAEGVAGAIRSRLNPPACEESAGSADCLETSVDVEGGLRGRENAIYLMLGENFFKHMHGAARIEEQRAFGESAESQKPVRVFKLRCDSDETKNLGEPVSLAECSACSGCRMGESLVAADSGH